MVKTALKLLLVFVEYTECNTILLLRAVYAVDNARSESLAKLPSLRSPLFLGFYCMPYIYISLMNDADAKPFSNLMAILDEKDGGDSELLVYVMTLINKVRPFLGSESLHLIISFIESLSLPGAECHP